MGAGAGTGDDAPPVEFVRDLERRRLRSLSEPDLNAATALHADDYQLIPPGGHPISKADYLGAIANRDLVYEAFEAASEIAVRTYRDAAVVRYRARIEVVMSSGERDSGLFWHTDVYERRDGQWQAVWSQATRIPPGDR